MDIEAHPLSTRAARGRVNKAFRAKGLPAKACSVCWRLEAHAQFNVDVGTPDGCTHACSACQRSAIESRRSELRAARAARWNGQRLTLCWVCGTDFEQDDVIHPDHFYPRSTYPELADEEWGVVPTHARCNMSRQNKEPWPAMTHTLAAMGVPHRDMLDAMRLAVDSVSHDDGA